MKQGEETSTAEDGRVFVLWEDQDLRKVFRELGFEVVDAFTNASALVTGETWPGYVLENCIRNKGPRAGLTPFAVPTELYFDATRRRFPVQPCRRHS